jgi:hypothetical protein
LDEQGQTVKRRALRLLLVLLLPLAGALHAHIGSPAVVFEGAAGPYPLRVIVLPAPVVPGRAEINVRLLGENPVGVKVTVLPVNWRAGLKGAPAPDEALAVSGDPALRHAQLWLMTSGSYSVHVAVTGERGSGTVIVPVVSVATRRLPMSPALGVLLAALGFLLFSGLITLVAVGVSDSTRENDSEPVPRRRAARNIAVGIACLLLGLGLYGGARWWRAEDRNFRNNAIYRPQPIVASTEARTGREMIDLEIPPGEDRASGTKLIADHGKLMHLFLIREPELDAMAHVHPVKTGPHKFEVPAPPLPRGRYRAYADVTFENGFAATLTTTVDLVGGKVEPPEVASQRDPDDSWFVGTPRDSGLADVRLELSGPAQFRRGEDVSLTFVAKAANGRAIELEPYMGMLGHAAVRRDDGSVFAHLHPVGTISMASQALFAWAAAKQTGAPPSEDHSMHMGHAAGTATVSFPYLFPEAGSYRIWVQTKIRGKIVTGVFDVSVTDGK